MYDTFDNNFGSYRKLEKYLKESFKLVSTQYFYFKYFMKITFVREISPKLSDIFVKPLLAWMG